MKIEVVAVKIGSSRWPMRIDRYVFILVNDQY
jgi:hypothetical protein